MSIAYWIGVEQSIILISSRDMPDTKLGMVYNLIEKC